MEPVPQVALRLAVTEGSRTRRIDVRIGAGTSSYVEGGGAAPTEAPTQFPTEELWPRLRTLLPDLAVLRADPAGRPRPERRDPPPGFAEACRAVVAVTTVVGERAVALRGWLATDDELWSSDPRPDGGTDLRPAAAGALADLLVWDVTGALQGALAAAAPGGATP